MKTATKNRFVLCLGALVAGVAADAFAQGSLTPPAGTPLPTMKTLVQVEPRIPISAAPYTISQPGSYYLTSNLVTAAGGIIIQTNRVTLDLMGFSITGDRGTSDMGIVIDGKTNAPCSNIVVRNGVVSEFGYGVYLKNAQDSRIEYVWVSGLDRTGICLDGNNGGTCSGNTVDHCSVWGGGYYGVEIYASNLGACNGNTFSDCTFRGNVFGGVNFAIGSGAGSQNVFMRCVVQENGGSGFKLENLAGGRCNGNSFDSCSVSGNEGYGLKLDGSGGELIGNRVTRCALYNNKTVGIHLWYGKGNQIDNNLVSVTRGASGTGIYVLGNTDYPNLVLQNTCVGQTNNYVLSSSSTYGPIVTASGALATTNGAAGLSPWANFSR
jgi:parallel beta-helix repeat protein